VRVLQVVVMGPATARVLQVVVMGPATPALMPPLPGRRTQSPLTQVSTHLRHQILFRPIETYKMQ
jgi:hypothetical protein